MNFSYPFIRGPVGTTLLAIGLFLLGAVAYVFLPVASLPSIDFPTIRVSASRPGADPTTMAATVAAPLERRLAEIAGVTEITSTSALGSTSIAVQFDLSRNIDGAARDVQAGLNAAASDLPTDLPMVPTFRKANPAAAPVLILALTSNTIAPSALYDVADTVIAQRISQVDGVAEVTVSGAEQPAIRVRVNPVALASIGLGMDDVRAAIVNSNAAGPDGAFDGAQQAQTIATNDQLRNARDYDPIVVRTVNGSVVRLSSVAAITPGVRNTLSAAWFNRQPSILLIITKQAQANVIETVDRIHGVLGDIKAWVPADLQISVLSDRTTTIRASVHDMQLTLCATIALVMMENVFRNLEAGSSPLRATIEGARQIGFTVVAISVSLIAAFIPLLFMGGIVGRLFREFSVTLAFAIAVSTVVSLSVTPMICAHFVRAPPSPSATWLDRVVSAVLDRLIRSYAGTLRNVLRHRALTMLAMLLTVALTVVLYVKVPKGYFPQDDTGLVFGGTEASTDISFKAMSELQQRAAAIVEADPAVAAVASSVGASNFNPSLNQGRLFISLKPLAERKITTARVVERLR